LFDVFLSARAKSSDQKISIVSHLIFWSSRWSNKLLYVEKTRLTIASRVLFILWVQSWNERSKFIMYATFFHSCSFIQSLRKSSRCLFFVWILKSNVWWLNQFEIFTFKHNARFIMQNVLSHLVLTFWIRLREVLCSFERWIAKKASCRWEKTLIAMTSCRI
jgi:hypothetical protein